MRPQSPKLIEKDAEGVAFLDAPGLTAAEVVSQVASALVTMSPGAVLTVHSDDPATLQALPPWCEAAGHDVVSIIRHDEQSSTFVLEVLGLGRSTEPA
ncbi:MAG: sulfurtransferase TusA family protein [Acidimicrobiales bacterium]